MPVLRSLLVLILITTLLITVACSSQLETTAATEATATMTLNPTTIPGPGYDELVVGGYASPQIPRVTSEYLKELIDARKEAGAYSRVWGQIIWDDFVIIDTLPTTHALSRDMHIEGSINIPFTFYWVKNELVDLKPDEREAYGREMHYLEGQLDELPKYELIIVYDDTDNDEAACILAQKLLDAGWDAGNILVLWKGFNHWYKDLRYPVVESTA